MSAYASALNAPARPIRRSMSQQYKSKYGAGFGVAGSESDAQLVRLVMSASTASLVTPHGGLETRLRRKKSILELALSDEVAAQLQKSVDEMEMKQKVTWLLLGCVGVAGTASFLNGYHASVMNAAETTALPGHTGLAWSLAVSAVAVGGPLGARLGGAMAAQRGVGRRGALLRTCMIYTVGSVVLVIASVMNWFLLVTFARLVLGVGCGATTVVVPLYLGELAPPRLRGQFGTATQLAMVTGILGADVVPVLPIEDVLRGCTALFVISGLIAGGAVVCSLVIPLQPSPRDVANSPEAAKPGELQQLCARLYGLAPADAASEADLLQHAAEAMTDASLSSCGTAAFPDSEEALKARSILFRSAHYLHAAQQLCGINAVFYYSTLFLDGVVDDPATGTVLIGIVNVVATLIASQVMDSSRRVVMLSISLGGMLLSALVMTLALTGVFASKSWALLGVTSYVFWFELGMGPIPWMIVPEMFDATRAAATQASASQLNWACNIIIGLLFPTLSATLGPYVFVPFAAIITAALFFVLSTLPETYGKLPEDVLSELIHKQNSATLYYGAVATSEGLNNNGGGFA